MKKIAIYDTTLRDGAQFEGISFTVKDKLRIAEKLDELGVDFIEGGWPGSNPKDNEFFASAREQLKLRNAELVAFGSTCRAGAQPSRDAVLANLLKAETRYVTIFGKSWDLHVKGVLKTTLKENLRIIRRSIKYLRKKGRKVIFDAEHFFDGYNENPDYALDTLRAAFDGGAEILVLCDTNGGQLTSRIFEVVEEVSDKVKAPLGIHVHNDADMAVANSVAAVQAGCEQVQGTFNGYGERCGNANLVSILPAIHFKLGYDCLKGFEFKELTETSRYLAEIANVKQQDSQPYVGKSAFAHKAGVHVNAILKDNRTYEHIEPEAVGNRRRMLISELSGKSSILSKAEEMGFGIDSSSDEAKKILSRVQDMEKEGYQFELAEASLTLLMNRAAEGAARHFKMVDFRVMVEKRGDSPLVSEATVKLSIGNELKHTVSLGDGPVHAMDRALRKAMLDFYPSLKEMHLSDFRVRVLDEKAGTAARVRVLIQSQDKSDSWWTVGVSENIIEASWLALKDSFEYKFLKDSSPSGKGNKRSGKAGTVEKKGT
ncbi:MAG: citramalate synthase [Candidatus Omnitrophica bacterium]|nr:citramalate synthase [Candidatus Omnitrophota bacterium]